MAGNDYRSGRKRVEMLLPLALHGRVRAAAAADGVSMADWLVEAARKAVGDDERDARPDAGRAAVSDQRGSRPSSGGHGPDSSGERSDRGGDPLVDPFDWDALEEEQGGVSLSAVVDRSVLAVASSRGRFPSPVPVDEWIDTA